MSNGFSRKTLKSEQGPIELAIPRDREGSYDSLLVKKHQTSLIGFNEKILWMYARGMSTRDIQAQLLEWYDVEVSPLSEPIYRQNEWVYLYGVKTRRVRIRLFLIQATLFSQRADLHTRTTNRFVGRPVNG
ncbi:MAG TPA: transposase [Ktedonobacteraceae bacterium]|nr:transposase [Ktedonobacteraceae bacterium]